jgi:hypothetical protein
MKEYKRAPWMGVLSGIWVVLVMSSYVLLPEHARKMALSFDGFRLWASAEISIIDVGREFPGHVRALSVVATGLVLAWLAGGAPAGWFQSRLAPFRIGLGLGCASLSMAGLGLTGLAMPPLFYAGGVFLAVAGWKTAGWRGSSRTRARPGLEPGAFLPGWISGVAVALAGISLLFNLLGALAPETGYDSLIQHLADPRSYLAGHRMAFNDLSFLAQHPAGVEMLYMGLLPAGGDSAARLLHVALGVLAAWAFYRWVLLRRPRADALLLASILYLVPFTGILSARSYIDNGLIFYGTLALLAPAGSWLQGAVIGLAIGAKYLGGFFLVGWVVALAASGSWSGVFRVVAGASLVAGWWGFRNLYNTGNPVYPFAFGIFGGLGWDSHSNAEYSGELSSYGAVQGLAGYPAIPWMASVRDRGALDDGSLGPLFLAFLPLALFFRPRSRNERLLSLNAGVLGLLWLVSPRQVRYALALLPPFLAALVPALSGALKAWPSARVAGSVAVLVALPVQFLLSFAAVYLWVNPWYVVTGSISRPGYLMAIIEPRDTRTGRSIYMEASERYPRILPPHSRTYMQGDAKVYFFSGDFLVNALFNPPLFARVVRESYGPDEVAKRLRQRGITHVLYNVGGSVHIEYVHQMHRWNDRELAVVEGFYRGWMRKEDTLGDSAGDPMYYLFKVERGRYPDPEYLPGIDTRMGAVESALAEKRREDAQKGARAMLADFPSSAFIRAWVRRVLGARLK